MGVVKVTNLLILAESALGCSFGVRALTEMKIWCIKDMHLLKVVSSKKKRVLKEAFIQIQTILCFQIIMYSLKICSMKCSGDMILLLEMFN